MPQRLQETLKRMATKSRQVSPPQKTFSEDEDWAFNDVWRMVKQGAGWEALGRHHPAKGWGLERSELEIQGPTGLMTYKGKEFVPPSKLKKALESIHTDHKGVIKGQLKAQQKWFWPHMEDHMREAMDICKECKDRQEPRDTPKEETREYQPPRPTTLLRGGIDY